MEWESAIKQRGKRDPSRIWNSGDSEHSITVSCAILELALHSDDTRCLSKMQICLDLLGAYQAPPLGSPDRVAHSKFTMCSKRIFRTRMSPAFSMVGFSDPHTLWWRRGHLSISQCWHSWSCASSLLPGRINHPLAPFSQRFLLRLHLKVRFTTLVANSHSFVFVRG